MISSVSRAPPLVTTPTAPSALPEHDVVRADRAGVAVLVAVDHDGRALAEELDERLGRELAYQRPSTA